MALDSLSQDEDARNLAFPGGVVPTPEVLALAAIEKLGAPPGRTSLARNAYHDDEVRRSMAVDLGDLRCPSGASSCQRCEHVRASSAGEGSESPAVERRGETSSRGASR